jgi:hypothetical protein
VIVSIHTIGQGSCPAPHAERGRRQCGGGRGELSPTVARIACVPTVKACDGVDLDFHTIQPEPARPTFNLGSPQAPVPWQ